MSDNPYQSPSTMHEDKRVLQRGIVADIALATFIAIAFAAAYVRHLTPHPLLLAFLLAISAAGVYVVGYFRGRIHEMNQ